VFAACAGARIESDVYHSLKGYRVTIPGRDWIVVDDSRADLEMKHSSGEAAMLVNASCEPVAHGRSLDVLGREILAGLRDREVNVLEPASVGGGESAHAIVEARRGGSDRGDDRVRMELYLVKGARCIFDLVYAATPAAFDRWRDDFHRLVATFGSE
jgi:hypothetical protein